MTLTVVAKFPEAVGVPLRMPVVAFIVRPVGAPVAELRRQCTVAAITRSEHGSVVVTPDGVISVPAKPVEQVIDTTGAGDLYAAGFLFGYTRGLSLDVCAELGHIASAEVISHVGPRPLVSLASLIPAL